MLICTVIPIKYRRLVWESVIPVQENYGLPRPLRGLAMTVWTFCSTFILQHFPEVQASGHRLFKRRLRADAGHDLAHFFGILDRKDCEAEIDIVDSPVEGIERNSVIERAVGTI